MIWGVAGNVRGLFVGYRCVAIKLLKVSSFCIDRLVSGTKIFGNMLFDNSSCEIRDEIRDEILRITPFCVKRESININCKN